MAQPKADVVVVPPAAMPEPDIAAELDALAARSSPSPSTRGGTARPAAREARPPLVVVGHRGSGMNALAAPPEDPRARGGDVRENTLRSFNAAAAAAAGVAYVEFDVQVRDRDHSVSHPHLGLARRGRQRPPLTTPVFF